MPYKKSVPKLLVGKTETNSQIVKEYCDIHDNFIITWMYNDLEFTGVGKNKNDAYEDLIRSIVDYTKLTSDREFFGNMLPKPPANKSKGLDDIFIIINDIRKPGKEKSDGINFNEFFGKGTHVVNHDTISKLLSKDNLDSEIQKMYKNLSPKLTEFSGKKIADEKFLEKIEEMQKLINLVRGNMPLHCTSENKMKFYELITSASKLIASDDAPDVLIAKEGLLQTLSNEWFQLVFLK